MAILADYPELMSALAGEMTPKFLATCSEAGVPNVVPCTSIMAAEDVDDRLIFGNFLLRKSVGNLDADPRVGILVITTDLEGWVLRGEFEGWQSSGTYVDRLNNTDLLRYNPYTGIRNAGLVRVTAFQRHFRLSKVQVLSDYLLARMARPFLGAAENTTTLPGPVVEAYSPMTAVRVLGFLDPEGKLDVVPVLSLQPKGATGKEIQGSQLVCAQGLAASALGTLPNRAPVAASLLTFDVVSFQVKGNWLGTRRLLGARLGAMSVTSVYAGGPPIPGRQVA
jgi:hypothetical protein